MIKFHKTNFVLILVTAFLLGNQFSGNACTRVVYTAPNQTVITARSMDWKTEIPANLWVMPRGIERNGVAGKNSVSWKSKYGSLIATTWDIATSDGMNEKGLVTNLLWLVESQYPKYNPEGNKKGLAISMWAQYVLDNFASVKEAVDHFKAGKIVVVSANIPGTEMFTTVHLSISDASGDNAILEYINGELVIHHDPSYTVMTNSPIFEEQLALNKYWKNIPGTIMLPGTNRAADRFVRASYYIEAIPKTDKMEIAIPSVFSVIRNCSVPFGISTPDEPNISSTRWRSVSDHKNLIYYFETTLTPNTFWVDLKKLDFSPGAKTKKLSVEKNETYAGESSAQFKVTAPFNFQGV